MVVKAEDWGVETNNGKPIKGYYVYGWVNVNWLGAYFYIGMGHGDRYKTVRGRGKAFEAILDNWDCFPVIIEDGLTEKEAEIREVEIKMDMIFNKGFPIMDGEGHSDSLKHLAIRHGKAVAREKEGYREGRPEKDKPADYEALVAAVAAGERTVTDVCREVGVSRGTWYKWQKSA